MKKKGFTRCLSGIGLGVLCILASSCKEQAAIPVNNEYEVLTVSTSDKEIRSLYSATIRGQQDIEIYPQVSGFITKLNVEEGQQVKKGRVLFIIDQVPYIAALETAKANVAAAEATLKTAKLNFDSRKELHAQNVVSAFDLQTAENNWLTAKAQLAQMKALELSAQNNLSYTEVKSPANGVIGTLPHREGALVSANMAQPLTTVSDNSVMYVYFSMNEKQLLELTRKYGSKNEAIKDMPEIDLILNDNSVYSKKGKIETISGIIDRNTGTVSLRAAFPNEEGLLFSGGSGNVQIQTQRNNCIVIPQYATFEIQDQVYVFKIVEGETSSAPIKVTRVNGGKEYIVESGLNPGEIIVAEGVGLLREGTPIQPKQEQQTTSTNAE